VVYLKPKGAGRQLHEMLEKSLHLGVSAVVTRQRSAPWDMPAYIFSKNRECTRYVPTGKRVVGAPNQVSIDFGRCRFFHFESPNRSQVLGAFSSQSHTG
jgi:hypothetical protein